MDITTTTMAMGSLASPSTAMAKLPLPADALATAQFSNLMAVPEITPLQPPVATEATVRATSLDKPTMGDNILGGLQSMASEFKQNVSNVTASLEAGTNMGISELLKVQVGLMQMSVQIEMVGKGISRSTQNLDQLVKIQ
jgi:type III secretion protein I